MANQNSTLTKEILHDLFIYKDGLLYKKPKSNRCRSDIIIGRNNGNGYLRTAINYKSYYIHRLIFVMFYGYFPKQIDHIDGNRSNNRIENLREANNAQNNWNKTTTKANTSGRKNVYWHSAAKKWAVEIKVNTVKKYIGIFDDLELADLVAQEARNKYFGSWANHF
jgi:hypothetical protein